MQFETILNTVWTVSEVVDLQQIIDVLNSSLYMTGKQGWEEVVTTQVGKKWSTFFVIQAEKRKGYLSELKQSLDNLKVMRISISFDPPQSTIENIGAWLRKNVSADIVLEIEVNQSLIAGAEISWQGKYADFSKKSEVNKLIDDYSV